MRAFFLGWVLTCFSIGTSALAGGSTPLSILPSGDVHRAAIDACGAVLSAMSAERPRAFWQSTQLSDTRVVSEERARDIVRRAIHDPALRAELEAYVGQLRNDNNQSRSLWNLYFSVYDQFVAYSNGYRSLIALADSALPQQGRIADLGSGTGNFSSVLLARAPGRSLLAIENSDLGVQLTSAKLGQLPGAQGRHEVQQRSLLDPGALAPNSLDGAVMNNVLYTFSAADQAIVLANIFRALRPGARLVMNDPSPELSRSATAVQNFITDIGVSAVRNGTNGSEFDLALLAYMNHSNLVANSSFLPMEQLATAARTAGFVVRESRSGLYYRGGNMLVLERP